MSVKPEDTVNQQVSVELEEDSVRPEDSASQCNGSAVSSMSGSRLWAKAMAKRAALKAEAERLKQQQELELEQLRLQQKRRELDLQTKIEIAQAEEQIFSLFDEERSSKVSRHPSHASKQEKKGSLQDSLQLEQKTQDETLLYPLDDKQTSFQGSYGVLPAPNQQLLEAISLQNVELMKFDGSLVGRTSLDDSSKLLKLFSCCQGETRSIIQSCMVMDSAVAYKKARSILEERYGNKFKRGDAWTKKVINGPTLQPSDKKGLQKFADELQVCCETLQAVDMVAEISSQQHLVKIVERLPYYLRARWLKVVKDVRHQGRSPKLKDVVRFVTDAACEINDPVYGELFGDKKKQPQGSKQSLGKRSSQAAGVNFAGSEKKKEVDCALCDKGHGIFSCNLFKDMKPEERLQMAKDKHLCFNCLKPGHSSSKCFLNRTCSVKGCNRKHSRFLHLKRKDDSQKTDVLKDTRQQSSSSSETDGTTASSSQNGFVETANSTFGNATGAGKRCVLLIVPVRVQAASGGKALRTFALLDTGSTNSFCTKSLAEKLNAKGQTQRLSLTTIDNEQTLETKVVDLVVDTGPMSEAVRIENVFTKERINIRSDHMASVGEISGWPHQQDINLTIARGQEIGLLIGQDAPEALIPLEVRKAETGP
ncbi:uncharacterized protein LOC135154495 [Lytechinus pictus]|uniref:uncharacterized protein LOC135154495 n=1 Tax=Lytechinus pictus TaxID=7653 RepID=UPI0030B9F119